MENYSEHDDNTLVMMTLLGKEKAYEELVLRYQRAVIASAYTVTRDHYLAEDAAQDAFVSAWIKLNSLREADKFGVWICRIARNRAKNTIRQFRDMLNYEDLQNTKLLAQEQFPPFPLLSEKNERLHNGIHKLSEKVRKVILMHYVEGLSLAEISDRLSIPVGTVKYRLYEGRDKLRKEMEDTMSNNETFTERVMKKVEEIKKWRLLDNKAGFEVLYREVLADIDQLPESQEKYSALADVLQCGFWWCEGEKSDEMREKIREAAEKGKNENVLTMIAAYEYQKFQGTEQIDFMRNKQIPRLEEAGYKKVAAYVWFWLGLNYSDSHQSTEALEAFETVLSLLTPADIYYANAVAAIRAEKAYASAEHEKIRVSATGEEYRLLDGKLRFWQQPGYSRGGHMKTEIDQGESIFFYASRCDRTFYDSEMKPGECYQSSDGESTLTFVANNETVQTAAGTFWGCEAWKYQGKTGKIITTWYKRNIGIVRQEKILPVGTIVTTLKRYQINGGTGLIPFAVGNRWEYALPQGIDPAYYEMENVFEVTSFDGTSAVVSHSSIAQRTGINENDWDEVITTARGNYWDRKNETQLKDVSHWLERAEELAATSYQKEHTRMANEVMRRIFETDERMNPARTASGHWNFFVCNMISTKGNQSTTYDNRTYSFEWKRKIENSGYPLLYNFIYDIFEDSMHCMWDEAWSIGQSGHLVGIGYAANATNDYSIEDGGTVTTAAGSFENCMLFRLNVSGLSGGLSYRNGKMEYWFAPGVGLVRAKHYYKEDTQCATYDLTSYAGIGEGYFPIAEGLNRKYEAIGLSDGFVAGTEYAFCRHDNGAMMLLQNQTGIRKLEKGN